MYYFASDTHLGLASESDPGIRERIFISWLDMAAADARGIFLVGDIFDFWFEYKRVVPKGHVRLLGKLAELVDRGIEVHFFPGNHDMWTGDCFTKEVGMTVHAGPEQMELYGKKVFVAHGDAMNIKGKPMLKLMNGFFRSRCARRIFSWIIHPDHFIKFGNRWSSGSRKSKQIKMEFRGEEEGLVQYAREYMQDHEVDYFVFGHIHCAEEYDLGRNAGGGFDDKANGLPAASGTASPSSPSSQNGRNTGGVKVFFLGEWFENPHYASLSPDGTMKLHRYAPGAH